jgi:hypothetical protein
MAPSESSESSESSKPQKNPIVIGAVILLAIVVLYLRFKQLAPMLGASDFCGCNCNRNCGTSCRRYLSERDNFSPDNPGACAAIAHTSEKWAAGLESASIDTINGY